MTPLEEAVAKLQSLGSADQIALYLEQQGITGQADNSLACPITNYLSKELSLDAWRSVETDERCVEITNYYGQRVETVDTLGTAVSQFVENFDLGDYPELESSQKPEDDDV